MTSELPALEDLTSSPLPPLSPGTRSISMPDKPRKRAEGIVVVKPEPCVKSEGVWVQHWPLNPVRQR